MRSLLRLLALLVLSAVALQAFFLLRIALAIVVDPQSTSFQRSEIWRLATERHHLAWSQNWVPYEHISVQLKRAVIASEDAGFTDHGGVDWDAIEKAWEKNQRAEARAQRTNLQLSPRQAAARSMPKLVGGSTITQQLAKNLFLDGERSLLRKGQEMVITFMLEALLSKQRILEIYLNNVEWGEGVFGAQAASHRYFHADVARLTAAQAARLAVMLPAPKRFELHPDGPYVMARSAVIVARMPAVDLP
jgi:monofunctional biosynthetic peptidoglycan transglycosylase